MYQQRAWKRLTTPAFHVVKLKGTFKRRDRCLNPFGAQVWNEIVSLDITSHMVCCGEVVRLLQLCFAGLTSKAQLRVPREILPANRGFIGSRQIRSDCRICPINCNTRGSFSLHFLDGWLNGRRANSMTVKLLAREASTTAARRERFARSKTRRALHPQPFMACRAEAKVKTRDAFVRGALVAAQESTLLLQQRAKGDS